ncbi:MAG: GAF domain-containing protein [Leptolyngbyaceae cyanobacterium RU_5_1]|nr:GAF domain-containing protein [Leptolyngbyaceae cyanobacterium RU_5_1]
MSEFSSKQSITLNLATYESLQQELVTLRQQIAGIAQQAGSHPTSVAQQRALLAVVTKIRESLDLETIFKSTATEVRQLLNADRVGMFRFDPDSNWEWGEFVSEDVLPPFDSALAARIDDHCFGENYAIYYKQGRAWAANDIYTLPLPDCHISILERFQVRANLVVPLLKGDRLWGLLCIHQCSGPRQWQLPEIEFVTQIAIHLGVALQQAEFVAQLQVQSDCLAQAVARAVEREKAVSTIIDKIRRSLDINTIFKTTAEEVRHLINSDRVVIYRFNPDWSGEFVVESVAEGWKSLVQEQVGHPELLANISECSLQQLANSSTTDTYLQETQGGTFSRGQLCRVCADIHQAGFSQCYVNILKSYQARSYAIIAIYKGQTLWGLLAAFQNSGPRQWEETDVNFLLQIGDQLSVAIQQAELLVQTQQRSAELQTTLEAQLQTRADELVREAERERALAQVIDKIRRTLDLDTIFQTVTTEVRKLLNADRVAVFCFEPGSGWNDGEFVSEDVVPPFDSALAAKVHDHCFGEHYATLYRQGRTWATDNIYALELLECHLSILSRFQVQANLVVPLLKGDELWGLLCIHQCLSSRHWQEKEVEFVTKIATQLGVALQQAELLTQAQQQSAELQKAKEAADAANRAKSQFLAHMSHELRTPLNAILGFTQVLARDTSLNQTQQQQLEIVARSGEHLLTLLNDVLEMSKIEAGQITLNKHSFDLYRLLRSLDDMLQLKAESKGLELSFDYPPDVPQYIYADESKLRQVLINLLGNATKFTAQGSVTLRVRGIENDELRMTNDGDLPSIHNSQFAILFEVEDTGPGIAPDELGRVFEAFLQTETGRRSQEGSGLGLPISQQFVHLMGGEITVSSVVGQGATFRFAIPVQLAEAGEIQLQPSTRRVIGLQPNQPTYRILVVDDKWESRLILVNLVAPFGFEVREAENGQEAVALWERWEPHLIWMDMRMPGIDGYEATRRIRATPKGQETVIIALTATVFDQQRSVVLEAGCNDFVSKPLQESVIFDKIAQYLGVRFLYEEEMVRSPSPSDTLELTKDALAVMPREWVTQLHEAAIQANEKLIFQLLEQVSPAHAPLASTLATLINDFRLETIIALTELND